MATGNIKPIETTRLVLRPLKADDFEAVHSYASCAENTAYVQFGPNSEEETRGYLARAIAAYENIPITNYDFAITIKECGVLIGSCGLFVEADCGTLGWVLHQDYWKMGYGTEAAKALLELGIDTLNLRRITATVCTENHGSYRIMEKIGMRREGHFFDVRKVKTQSNRKYYDDYLYAILRDEWQVQKEIAYYNALPCEFKGFVSIPVLTDGEVFLVCTDRAMANPDKKLVPYYGFAICKGGEKIGRVDLRIGYGGGPHDCNLYYGGQIGYEIDEAHRGKGYAAAACRLVVPIAKAHKMEKLLITNNIDNAPSRRVCEKLGARLVRMVRLPEWTDLYRDGQRFSNIYEWAI